MKIQIIGYSGSGKSTLAKRLGEFYKVPCLHLDNVNFYGDWQERTFEEKNQILKDFLSLNNNWVIDGNYNELAPERFQLADITIYLSFNRFFCYRMCKRRYKEYKGKSRLSCPCEEKFDWEFRKWILFAGRTRKRKRNHIANLNKTSGQKQIFYNRRQLSNWLKSLGINEPD